MCVCVLLCLRFNIQARVSHKTERVMKSILESNNGVVSRGRTPHPSPTQPEKYPVGGKVGVNRHIIVCLHYPTGKIVSIALTGVIVRHCCPRSSRRRVRPWRRTSACLWSCRLTTLTPCSTSPWWQTRAYRSQTNCPRTPFTPRSFRQVSRSAKPQNHHFNMSRDLSALYVLLKFEVQVFL